MRYWIKSKLLKKVIFIGTTDNFDNSKKCHLDYLRHNHHPHPEVLDHVQRYGLKDIEFLSDEIKPVEKEKRRVKKVEKVV